MSRLTDNDINWGPFTLARWSNLFSIVYECGDRWNEDVHPRFMAVGFGRAIRIWLPKWLCITPKSEGKVEYGASISNMGNGFDFVQVFYGLQTGDSSTTQSWCKHLPWKQWDCVRHSLYFPDGKHFYTEEKGKWKDFFAQKDKCPSRKFQFGDYDGELIMATCKVEEREWHRGEGWFKWLKWFYPAKIKRSLDLSFSAEVGPQKGSWKGGTLGHGIDMLPNETVEDAFRRYCSMEHERKGRKFMLTYLGELK